MQGELVSPFYLVNHYNLLLIILLLKHAFIKGVSAVRNVYIFQKNATSGVQIWPQTHGCKTATRDLPLQLLYALWGTYWINIPLILVSYHHDNGNAYLWRYSLSLIHTEVAPISINGSQANVLGRCNNLICFSVMRKTRMKSSYYHTAPKRQERNSTIL